ncbi:MAG: hypothetical protein ABIT83_26065 [Massilia sp.]
MKTIVFSVSFLLSVSACTKTNEENIRSTEPNIVKIGESGAELQKRLQPKIKLDAHPAGIHFYKMNWGIKNSQTVTFEHGKSSLKIDHCLSLLASQDEVFSKEGISEIDVNCVLATTDLLQHEQARHLFEGHLKNALSHGWREVIPRYLPRIHGQDMLQYQFSNDTFVTLDANYIPTAEEWLKLRNNTSWELYANGVFLSIRIDRYQPKAVKSTPDAYMIFYNFQNENNYYRGFVENEFRTEWLSKLASALVPEAEERAKREAEVRALGIPIDEGYVDPPLPTALTR